MSLNIIISCNYSKHLFENKDHLLRLFKFESQTIHIHLIKLHSLLIIGSL